MFEKSSGTGVIYSNPIFLTDYQVRIVGPGRQAGDNYNVTHNAAQPHHHKLINNLQSDSTYTVYVSAATVIGLGPSSQITKATRPPPGM